MIIVTMKENFRKKSTEGKPSKLTQILKVALFHNECELSHVRGQEFSLNY
jgi:hypothetical protein